MNMRHPNKGTYVFMRIQITKGMRHTKKTKVVDNFMKNHLTNFLSFKPFEKSAYLFT